MVNDTYQERIINNVVIPKKVRIFADNFEKFFSFTGMKFNWLPLFEVFVFFSCFRIRIVILPSVPRSLDVIPLHDLLACIEHIGHDYEIAFADYFSLLVFFNQFVKAVEFCDQSLRIILDVVIVIF